MAKFHIKLKLQGLELDVEGTREDLPVIREALTQQFAGLMAPATDIADGETSEVGRRFTGIPAQVVVPTSPVQNVKRPRRKSRTSNESQAGATDVPVDWRHETTKYGGPKQSWTTAQKAIWLLYVVSSEANVPELSGKQLEVTFNKHFRSAGAIRQNNIIRDLGKLKTGASGEPPQVSQDTSKDPSMWYLNESGIRAAEKLVAEAIGQTL